MFITKIRESYMQNTLLFKNIIGTYAIKGGSLLITVLTLPAYMNYFPDESILGLWFTILSILQWIFTFDMGIGNGLRNKIVPALIEKDYISIKKYISSSYILLGCVAFVIVVIGCIIIFTCNWTTILMISPELISNQVLRLVIVLVFTGVIFQFFLSIITSILFAMQKNVVANLVSLVSSLLILIYIYLFKTGNLETDLINLALINNLFINIPLLLANILVFSTILKESKPSFNSLDKKYAQNIIKLSGNFFWIQLTLLFMNSTNEILIAWLYGPKYVVEYQVYFRLFYMVVTLFSLVTNPVWSAISVAIAKKQFAWIININRKLKIIVLCITFINLLFLFYSQPIVDIWLKDEAININHSYAAIFVVFSTISMFNLAASVVANGIGMLKCQIICYSIAAIVKIPLIILVSYFLNEWILVIAIHSIVILPYSIIQPIILNKFYKSSETQVKF